MGSDFYKSRRGKHEIPIGIGENCIIKNAIVDKNARIGNNVRIINQDNVQTADKKNYYIREGIVVIPKNTTIPDNQII